MSNNLLIGLNRLLECILTISSVDPCDHYAACWVTLSLYYSHFCSFYISFLDDFSSCEWIFFCFFLKFLNVFLLLQIATAFSLMALFCSFSSLAIQAAELELLESM